jgi:mannose-1-phosphate guanylyltransferase
MSSIAVIMVGGPTTSNFRALGSVPAPLFPIAGRALLHHPITAAAAVPGISAVYVLGFYEEREFAPYLATMSAEVGIPVRYLCESRGHGSAGGLHQFRDTLLQENPGSMFLVNCDVCCAFPLVGACRCASPRVCHARAALARCTATHAPWHASGGRCTARCSARHGR